jgi:aspartate carbamoyltransferase catalytic subunit
MAEYGEEINIIAYEGRQHHNCAVLLSLLRLNMPGKRFNDPSIPEITRLDVTPETVIPVEGSLLEKTARLRLTNLAFQSDITDAVKSHEAAASHPLASTQKNGMMSASDKLKLDAVQLGATANSSDVHLLERGNHTGEQSWVTITDTPTTLSGYGIIDAAPLINGQIPTSYLPTQALIDIITVNSQAEMLALTGLNVGDRAYRSDLTENRLFTLIALPATNLNNWQRDSIGIQTVNGQSGPTIVLDAADIGAERAGAADSVLGSHAQLQGNGEHLPEGGITDANVASDAAITWGKISKVGATPGDIGAQPSGSYAPNPILNAHISPDAAIAWGKISKVGATPGDIGAQPSGSYAPNPVLNTHIAANAAISWEKISKVGATPGDIGAQPSGNYAPNPVLNAHIGANAAIDASKIIVAATGNLTGRDLQSAVSYLEIRSRTHSWANVTNTPTTLSGYGITDAAPLVNGQIPTSFLPSQALIDIVTVNSQAEMLAITGFGVGDRAYRSDLTENRLFTLIALPATNLNNWQRDSIGIQTVNGQSGPTIVLGAANVGADPVGTADAAVANHASQRGNGTHIPTGGIANANVASNAAIAWDKISKVGATPGDIGAQPSGSYAPNPVLNTHISPDAAIAWGKISKVGATPGDIGAQPSGNYAPNPVLNTHIAANAAIDATKIVVASTGNLTARDLQSAVSFLETRTRTHSWANVTNTPTTLSGYGITDAAPLVNGQIPTSFLPSQALIDIVTVNSQAEMLAITGFGVGDRAYRSDLTENRLFTLIALPATNLNNWQRDSIGIQTVNGQSGPTIVLGAANVGADPVGTADAAVANHASQRGNGAHIPTAGITDTQVAGNAAIAWGKVSKSGATPADIGAQPSGNYAPNPLLNAHIAPEAAIAASKIAVATAGNLTGRDLQAAVTYLEARTRVQENIAMNGDFLVAQRGTSFSIPSGMQSFYTLDRWAVSFSGTATATVTQSLSNIPTVEQAGLHPGASFQLAVNTAQAAYAADQWAGIYHRVEGILLRRFFSQIPYTVSFWVKSSRPGTYCLATRTGGFTHSCVVEYTINAANTWERKVLNFPALPSGNWNYSNGTGVEFFWTLACGSNFRSPTPGAWSNVSVIGTANQVNFNETSGNTFVLSLVKVEPGTTPTLFVPSLQSELECKRYYTRVALSAMGYTPQALGYVGTLVALPVPMRLGPSAKVAGALSRSNISTASNAQPAVGMGSTREGYFIAYSEIAGHCWVLNELWEFNAEL